LAKVGIGRDPLDSSAAEAHVSLDGNGGICTFVGQVRNSSQGQSIKYLEYDAYLPLAEKELLRIALEAETRWPVNVAIFHRLGRIEIGEASVVVAVGSPHRAESFEACRWCIDTLKQNVPIWKRETSEDGSFWIEGQDSLKAEEY